MSGPTADATTMMATAAAGTETLAAMPKRRVAAGKAEVVQIATTMIARDVRIAGMAAGSAIPAAIPRLPVEAGKTAADKQGCVRPSVRTHRRFTAVTPRGEPSWRQDLPHRLRMAGQNPLLPIDCRRMGSGRREAGRPEKHGQDCGRTSDGGRCGAHDDEPDRILLKTRRRSSSTSGRVVGITPGQVLGQSCAPAVLQSSFREDRGNARV